MLLLVSHITPNRGTADYFRTFLKSKKITHYYLTHPLNSTAESFSKLSYFDGEQDILIKSYPTFNGNIFSYAHSTLINAYTFVKLYRRITTIYAFGSFNAIVFSLAAYLNKKSLIFWGVDYSRRRFDNSLLNKIYEFSETLACKTASLTINVTARQEEARLQSHGLHRERSYICPNGVQMFPIKKKIAISRSHAFLYMGSITEQHGIVDLIKFLYVDNTVGIPIYVLGGGSFSGKLKDMITVNKLESMVHYEGFKTLSECNIFLDNIAFKLVGLAPYTDTGADHVYFGDSLKIKEYLSRGIPFICTSLTYIDPALRSFGFVYNEHQLLIDKINERFLANLDLEVANVSKVLSNYKWDLLFTNLQARVSEIK